MAEKYEKISKVGEGSFGVVWKVRHKDTGGVFAIKKIRMQSRDHGVSMAAIDEINALQELRHKHVVTLHEVYAKNGGNIFLVFDFLDVDLEQIISAKDPAREPYVALDHEDVTAYSHMLLQAVAACHDRGFLHRDLKPGNLLIDRCGTLKLGDFGLARPFGSPQQHQYTPGAFTRWYRPPELLLSCYLYGEGADMWSVACIIAEMYQRQPLFTSETDIGQINAIMLKMGSPDEGLYARLLSHRGSAGAGQTDMQLTFTPREATPMAQLLPRACPAALDLIGALLDYDPDKRPSAVAALAHEYFSSVPQCSSSEAAAAQARRAADIDALRRTAPSARPVNGVGVTAEQLVSWRRMVSFFDCDCGIGGGEPFGVPPGHATSLPPGTRVSRTAGRGGVAHDVPSMGSLGGAVGAGGAGGAGGGSASSRRVSGRYEPYERVGGRVLGASGGSANAVCRHSSMDVSSCGDESLCVTGGDDALLGGGGHESLENVIDGETPGEGAPIASADKMRGGGLRGAVKTPSGIGGDAIEAIRNPNLNMSDSLDASAVYAQGLSDTVGSGGTPGNMLLCFSDGPRERARGVPADLSRERDGETRLERDGVDAMDLTPAATRTINFSTPEVGGGCDAGRMAAMSAAQSGTASASLNHSGGASTTVLSPVGEMDVSILPGSGAPSTGKRRRDADPDEGQWETPRDLQLDMSISPH